MQQTEQTAMLSRTKRDKIEFDTHKERKQFYLSTPIKSREELMVPRNEESLSPLLNQTGLLSPQEMVKKNSKIKKYFSKDVRSHYDSNDDYLND
jgi:hypothetical protein